MVIVIIFKDFGIIIEVNKVLKFPAFFNYLIKLQKILIKDYSKIPYKKNLKMNFWVFS